MSTRTRSRARQPVQEEVQARITETFKATRKGTSAPSKSLKEAVIEDVKPKTATKTTKRVKKEQIVVKEVERAAEKTEKEASIPPISPLESPPRRPRKTPTPPSSPPREEKPAVRRLFSNAEPEVPALPFGLKEKPAEPKKTKVNLMERLAAKNPSLAKIHEQMSTNKAKRVEQHVELLKSPTKAAGLPLSPKKMAPVFISPTKRPAAIKVGKKPLSNTEPVPEFVLPSHTTPAKERTEEEEAVELSKRHLFEKGHTARLFDVVKNNNEVELPHKYQNLLEKFHCCDRIVSIFTGRGSRCEATEIFKNVQKNTKKEFGRKTLAQIMALYPKSYNLRLEEQRNLAGQLIGRFDLVLEPNLVDDLSEYMRPESPKKALMEEPLPKVLPGHCLSPMKSPRKKIAQPEAREAELDLRSKLEGWRIMNRKYIMYHLLAERVQKCHQKFMEKLGEKIGPIRRFHPSFLAKLDAECVDIEPAALPEPPRKEVAFKNVEEFMSSLREPETAVDVALKELAAGEETSTSRNIPLSPKKFAQIQAAKPAGARSLLERIRAKEAVKKAAESQRDPEAERCYHLLELLHSKLIRPLLSMYVQKNCRSMQLQLALEKLEYSTKRTKTELLSCLEYLCVTAPNHARIAEVASSKYLQIEQTAHEDIRRAIKTAFEATSRPSTFSITSR